MKKITTVLLIAGIGFCINSCKKTEEKVAPTACFSISPTEIHAGDVITFSTDCSQNATTFSWDFGDSGTSTDASPTHTYNTAGDYTITLTVKDAAGLSNSSSQTITVAEAVIPAGNMHEGNITANETWAAGIHEVTGDVYVDGATLTIEPGTIIKFDQGTGLYIGYSGGSAGATLIANGSSDKPIVFTSSADTPAAGDWYFIGFYSGASSSCSMKYCTVEYGGGDGQYYGNIYIENSSVTIENSNVKNTATSGIVLNEQGSFKSFTADTVNTTTGYAVEIYGEYAHTIGLNNVFNTATGVRVAGDTYDKADQTWNKLDVPYVIDGDLYIQNTTGAKLTIAPGTRVEFTQGSGIYIGYESNTFGTLIAAGTETDSIYFTSAAIAGSETPGDWYYLGFYKGAGNNSVLQYCVVQYGGGDSEYYGEIYLEGSSVKIDNSKIGKSSNIGIVLQTDAKFGSFTNNVVEDNPQYPVSLFANNANTIGDGNTYSSPGILVKGATIATNVTWLKQSSPYIVDGEVYVQSNTGNTLTIAAGTVIEFTQGSEFDIGYNGAGTLIAQGSASDSIMFTSASPAGNQSPGDWDGVFFYGGTGSGSVMSMCHLAFAGGYSTESGNVTVEGAIAGRPSISNCNLTDSNAYGIYITSGDSPTLSGNTFANNASGDTN